MVSKLFDLLLFLPARNKSFSQSVKSTNFFPVQAFLLNQVIFPESRDFSTVKEFFYIHGIFQESRNFLAIKEFYHSPESFPQSWNFSTVNGIFHKNNIQTRKFSMKYFSFVYQVFHKQSFSHSQKRFFQTKIKKLI